MTLFVSQSFISHSGLTLPFKIDCDALTDSDLSTLATEIAKRVTFGGVIGIPRGGIRLATALIPYLGSDNEPYLIVDDVLTTGASMEAERARLITTGAEYADNIIGIVIFSRGPCPAWVTPIFSLNEKLL